MTDRPHLRTPYRDIVQDENGGWVTRRGIECENCGQPWPCPWADTEETP